MSIKGYTTNKNRKSHPIYAKKGITEKQFKQLNTKDRIKIDNEIIKIKPKGNDQIVGIDSGKIHNKITIKNGIISPNHTVLEAIVSIWSDVPDDIKKLVKKIVIKETEEYSGEWNDKTHTLTLGLSNDIYRTETDVEDTLSHELAHVDFDDMMKRINSDPKLKNKMIRYFDEMAMLPPITMYSKTYYDDYIKERNFLDQEKYRWHDLSKKELDEKEAEVTGKALLWMNETHSDTAMYKASADKTRPELLVTYEPAMEKAVKNFNKLHSKK